MYVSPPSSLLGLSGQGSWAGARRSLDSHGGGRQIKTLSSFTKYLFVCVCTVHGQCVESVLSGHRGRWFHTQVFTLRLAGKHLYY